MNTHLVGDRPRLGIGDTGDCRNGGNATACGFFLNHRFHNQFGTSKQFTFSYQTWISPSR